MSKWQLLGNKKKLWSDIWKIKYLCNIATSSPSSNAVHTAPYSLYFSNINIYKPEGDSWYSNIDKGKGDTDSLTKFLLTHHEEIYLLRWQLIYQYIWT